MQETPTRPTWCVRIIGSMPPPMAFLAQKKKKMGRGSGEGEVTNERLEFDHLKISDYGPLQSSDGRQE